MALVHRGVDVDVTPEQAVLRVSARHYRYVLPALEANLAGVLRLPRADHEGAVRIVGFAGTDPTPARETARLVVALFVIAAIALLLAHA